MGEFLLFLLNKSIIKLVVTVITNIFKNLTVLDSC